MPNNANIFNQYNIISDLSTKPLLYKPLPLLQA